MYVSVGQAPTIAQQPAPSVTGIAGSAVALSTYVGGSPTPLVQWSLNGTAITGATSTALYLGNLTAASAGSYSLTAINAFGSATTNASVVTVLSAPTITSQPQGQVVDTGSTVTLSVTASGSPAPTGYQWNLNAAPIAGASSSAYAISQAVNAQSGDYTVTVTNSIGSTASTPAVLTVRAPVLAYAEGPVSGGASGDIVAGFSVTGTRMVIVVGVGPSLGVAGSLAAPTVTIEDSSHAVVGSNTNWQTAANLSTVQAVSPGYAGLPLSVANADSAMIIQLTTGHYTAVLSSSDATSGIGAIGVYDLSGLAATAPSTAVRGPVGSTQGLATSFLVAGGTPATVLVTGVGPGLVNFGVSGYLDAPTITLADSTGAVLGTNTGYLNAANVSAITSAVAAGGLVSLTGADSAVLVTSVTPGVYTATVTSSDATSGEAMVEVSQQ